MEMSSNEEKIGRIVFTLDEYLEAHKNPPERLSKNKIALGAKVQRTQLNKYFANKIQRPDVDVLARLCYFLGCELSDIMKYEK